MKKHQMRVMVDIGIPISIIILIVSSIFLLNKSILSSNAPKTMRLIVQTIASPNDFYDFLINEDLDISKKGLIKRFDLKNKYTGRHDVGVLLDKFSSDFYSKPLSQRYSLTLKMEINFYSQNSLIFSRIVETKYDPFLGRKGNGFSFITYDCPKDLPLAKLLTCEVKVIEPDPILYASLGPSWFYVRKMSDK